MSGNSFGLSANERNISGVIGTSKCSKPHSLARLISDS